MVPALWEIVTVTTTACCCCCWQSLNGIKSHRHNSSRAYGQSLYGIEWYNCSGAISKQGQRARFDQELTVPVRAVVAAALRARVLGGSFATSNRRFFLPTLFEGNDPCRFWPKGGRHLRKFLPVRQPPTVFFFHHTGSTKTSSERHPRPCNWQQRPGAHGAFVAVVEWTRDIG